MGHLKSYPDRINCGEDDEMTIVGYRLSMLKVLMTWMLIFLSGGFLLLLMSWKPSVKLRLTHSRCSLAEATKVFLKDEYKQEYVETIVRPEAEQDVSSGKKIHFWNKKIKYIWKADAQQFVKLRGLENYNCTAIHELSEGLSGDAVSYASHLYGRNSIHIEVKPVWKLILQEVTNPFYLYQVFIVIVWLVQLYYQFALCIVLLSVISVTVSVWQTRKQSIALRDTVHSESIVSVLRDGFEQQKPSYELVPGDVLVLPQNHFTMECDAVLINGNCVVNESMLTGESIPISKVPIPHDSQIIYSPSVHKKNTLFCGTQVLHSRLAEGSKIKAVVVRTGFSTAKGDLVRTILFPKPVDFKLYQDLFKCMRIFIIIGIPAMIYTGVMWYKVGASTKDIIITVIDVATFLFPPLLPATFTCINAYAQRRLKEEGIFCLNSRHINFCGGLDTVCFDKTGTLTEDSLDLSGAIPVNSEHRFQPAVRDIKSISGSPLFMAMATCHSLSLVNGEILGYTLDVKMFEAVGWELEEPLSDAETNFTRTPPVIVREKHNIGVEDIKEVAIVRQFPFESSLQRMTVVTIESHSKNFEVFMKGAPEMIASFSDRNTIPENFESTLENYTRQGFRVLAVGWKILPSDVSWDEVLKIPREELEQNLVFQGLLVLQNRLKPETMPALQLLRQADIRPIMVTGDNLLTAVSIARDSGMIDESDSVICVEAEHAPTQDYLQVRYSYVKFPGYSEKISSTQNGLSQDLEIPLLHNHKYHLALDGTTFQLIRQYDHKLMEKIVHKGTIFARMLPEQKLQLIEALQNLGHQVGMCGDGANDCGALKAAHAGVSLSVAEASVASPFTSKVQNIQCIPNVIREGRATLTATFGAFRYMVSYCFILLSAVLILFWEGQKPSDGAYVLIDIILNILPPIVFGGTKAYPELVKRRPIRSILSFLPQFSMFSFVLIQLGVYLIAWYYCLSQPWYEPFTYSLDKAHSPDPSYTVMTILNVNMMSYVISAVIFSPGPPYRQNFLSNKLYVAVVIIDFALVTYLMLYPAEFLLRMLKFRPAPYIDYNLVLYSFSLANFIVCYIWEIFFVQGFLFGYVMPFLRQIRGPVHRYEELEQELANNEKWPPTDQVEIAGRQYHNQWSGEAKEKQHSASLYSSVPAQQRQWSRSSTSSQQFHLQELRLSISSAHNNYSTNDSDATKFITFHDGTHQVLSSFATGKRDSVSDDFV